MSKNSKKHGGHGEGHHGGGWTEIVGLDVAGPGDTLAPDATTIDMRLKISGLAGDDMITGGNNRDKIWGGDGADTISGGGGNDKIWGGLGDDKIDGNAGNDHIWGGEGNDIINGDDAAVAAPVAAKSSDGSMKVGNNDRIWGGAGDDIINGNQGSDRIWGGAGNDTINGDDAAVVPPVAAKSSDGAVMATNNDRIYGGAGNDTINGGEGNDRLEGGSGDDIVNGDAGNDSLRGGEGVDKLDGGAGNDILRGGSGDDSLTGGDGNDVFKFSGISGHDTITDFKIANLDASVSTDRIDIQSFGITDVTAFLAGIVYDAAGATITLDANTSITVTGAAAASLVAADFII
jgi:Ca2+-binding RTX toxin-like protein